MLMALAELFVLIFNSFFNFEFQFKLKEVKWEVRKKTNSFFVNLVRFSTLAKPLRSNVKSGRLFDAFLLCRFSLITKKNLEVVISPVLLVSIHLSPSLKKKNTC